MAKKTAKKRKDRRTRARSGQGTLEQLKQITVAQRQAKTGKIHVVIESIGKSNSEFATS